MARKQRQLSDAFGQLNTNKTDTETVEVIHNSNPSKENKDVLKPSEAEQKDVTDNSNTEYVPEDVTLNVIQKPSDVSVAQIKDDLLSLYEEKTKKEKVEDTHIRTTFLFRKDLSKRLEKLAKNKRGFKTLFMNKAIEALLDELEKK